MDSEKLKHRLKSNGLKYRDVAEFLDISPEKVSKVFNGVRQWRGDELVKLLSWLDRIEKGLSVASAPDLPTPDDRRSYLPIEVLPSYAGMGGGGNGEGDIETALVSRALIEDELRAKPSDLLLIDVRGDSMEPDFQHGDQILIDRRDNNPIQPGPFAMRDADGYVVKLVERIPQKSGWYQIFSSNERYASYEVEASEVYIMGRPVWFGRRL